MLADINADEIKELMKDMENVDLKTKEDVKRFVTSFTKLTYDHMMFGLMIDFYEKDVEVLKENRNRIKGIEAVVYDRQVLKAAFPNLTTKIGNLIVTGNAEDGYKIFRRMRYEGDNTGASQYGPATGKSLGKSCLGLSMFYMKKINGSWKITHEMDMRSAEWMKQVMTTDSVK